jgi:hypothetical protein
MQGDTIGQFEEDSQPENFAVSEILHIRPASPWATPCAPQITAQKVGCDYFLNIPPPASLLSGLPLRQA